MRPRLAIPFVVLATFVAGPVFAQTPDAPQIPYRSVPDFIKMPEGLYMGEAMGVATNSQGEFFVYTRSGEATRLFKFDEDGNFMREIGQGLYGFAFAHAVRVDADDNIWVVDEGTDMVIKFNPEGRVLMTIGRRPEAQGLSETPERGTPPREPRPYNFGRPTDIGWDPQGNIFVSDGYTNSRVIKFDPEGRYLGEVGSRGSEIGQLSTPHTMQVDAEGNVYVGDRGNRRIQVFDNDLNFKFVIDGIGAPWGICISPGPHQYLYSSNSNTTGNSAESYRTAGEIYKMELDGTIIGRFGRGGKRLGEFGSTHAMDCRNPDELLVAEVTTFRVQKIILEPTPASQ
jgi:DNA-binding beta-propeller fold protein YncE